MATADCLQRNKATGAWEPILHRERPSLFCDRCQRDFDIQERVLPIQSKVCAHSICTSCLDSIALRGGIGCTVDCHSCQASDAFDTCTRNRKINLLACAGLDVIRRREDYWDNILYVFQAKVQELEMQLLERSSKALPQDSTCTPQSTPNCLGITPDESKKNSSIIKRCSRATEEKPTINDKPAECAIESTYYDESFKTTKARSQPPSKRSEKDESLQSSVKVIPVPREYPRSVLVRQGAVCLHAHLLSVQGKKALIKLHGCDEEETVGIDAVTEFVPGDIHSHGKQNQKHQDGSYQNPADDGSKVPLNDGENFPLQLSTPLQPIAVRRGRSAVAKLESTLDAEQPVRRKPGKPRKDALPLAVLQNEQPIRVTRTSKESVDDKTAILQKIEPALPLGQRRPRRDAVARAQQELIKLGTGRSGKTSTLEDSALPLTGETPKVLGREEVSACPSPATVAGEQHRPRNMATLEVSTRRRPGKPQKLVPVVDEFSPRVTGGAGRHATVMTSNDSADALKKRRPRRPRNVADGDSPTESMKRKSERTRKASISDEARGCNSKKRKSDGESGKAWHPSIGVEESLAPQPKRPRRSAAYDSQKR